MGLKSQLHRNLHHPIRPIDVKYYYYREMRRAIRVPPWPSEHPDGIGPYRTQPDGRLRFPLFPPGLSYRIGSVLPLSATPFSNTGVPESASPPTDFAKSASIV
jgi:hypothetical protein